jgi:hypothetical protein
LTEALLKTRKRRSKALDAIRQASISSLPIYALKEFKAGPLDHFIWLHNKLLSTNSLKSTYDAIARNIRRPYRVTTSLEALQVGSEGLSSASITGPESAREADRRNAAMYMFAIRRRILRGWSDRRRITTTVFDPTDCFAETAPFFDETTSLLENPGKTCAASVECSLAKRLKEKREKISKLIQIIAGSTRNEDNRRRAALRMLYNTPNRKFEHKDCQNLGDAYFALRCPNDFSILTSNVRDHSLLAGALGITVEPFVLDKQ